MTDRIKSHCNNCGHAWHAVLFKEVNPWTEAIDPVNQYSGTDTYLLCKCGGCDGISLRHDSWQDGEWDEDGEPLVRTTYYPPAISRELPNWLFNLKGNLNFDPDEPIRGLLREIYAALHNNSRRLAVMGLRALLEHVMTDIVGPRNTFKELTLAFAYDGYLSPKQKEILETILSAGHAATHRAYNPSREDLEALLDLSESIIETIYVHGRQAKKLDARIPPRKRPGARSKK